MRFLVLLILYLLSLQSSDRCCCWIGFRSRTAGVLSLLQMLRQGHGWTRCLLFPIVFLVMVILFRLFDTSLLCVQLLYRIIPFFVSVGSLSVLGRQCGVGLTDGTNRYRVGVVIHIPEGQLLTRLEEGAEAWPDASQDRLGLQLKSETMTAVM